MATLLTPRGLERYYLLQDRTQALLESYPRMVPLVRRLLELGGHVYVSMGPDPDAETILDRGTEVASENLRYEYGEPSRCHHNAARLWLEDTGRYRLFTGYGLTWDADGLGCWRQHSWLWDAREDRLVETTERRSVYFGFELSDDEARLFAMRLAGL